MSLWAWLLAVSSGFVGGWCVSQILARRELDDIERWANDHLDALERTIEANKRRDT